jgi:hypothetical protein
MSDNYRCPTHGGYREHAHHCPECVFDAVTLLRHIADGGALPRRAATIAIEMLGYANLTRPRDHQERLDRLMALPAGTPAAPNKMKIIYRDGWSETFRTARRILFQDTRAFVFNDNGQISFWCDKREILEVIAL